MDKIYDEIGEIIKIVQYIEYNLAELIEYKMILDLFESRSTVPDSEFKRTEDRSEERRVGKECRL